MAFFNLHCFIGSFYRRNCKNLIEAVIPPRYANMPVQYTAIFHGCKNGNFSVKNVIFFLLLLKTLIVGTR